MILTYKFEDLVKDKNFINQLDNFPDFKDTFENYKDYLSEEDDDFKVHLYYNDDEEGLVGIVTTNVVRPDWGVRISSPLNRAKWFGNLEINIDLRGKGYGSNFVNQLTKSGRWIISAHSDKILFYERLCFIDILSKGDMHVLVKGFSDKQIEDIVRDEYTKIILDL